MSRTNQTHHHDLFFFSLIFFLFCRFFSLFFWLFIFRGKRAVWPYSFFAMHYVLCCWSRRQQQQRKKVIVGQVAHGPFQVIGLVKKKENDDDCDFFLVGKKEMSDLSP